jgi:hypothetical protein
VSPWLRVLGLFAAAVLAALVLKRLPPLVVLALLVAAVAYANHVLIGKPKRERALATAQALGMRPVPDEEAGLRALPFTLLTRPGAVASQVMAGPWRGREIRVFDLELARPEAQAGVSRFTCALWVPAKDRDLVLEAVSGFLAAVPAGRSSGGR